MSPTPLKLYNSLTKKKEVFSSLEPGKVKLYNCGPTVYKRPHLGNLRRFLFADFLRRSLELIGYEVRDITNITDVGHLTQDDIEAGRDKLEQEAEAQKLTPQQIAEKVTEQYFADIAALNIKPAHKYPRATHHIKEMQDLITQLLEKQHAYVTADGVYYDVQSFPEYGKLSGNTLDKIQAGARVEVRSEKKHPADFALWKLNDPAHLQQWDSPWGRGYPGWHIECSAMSMAYLGPQLDIHTGGEDNKFPHHENEIAQSEGVTEEPFSKFWLHNAFLQLGGAKLAKREGEQLTLDSLSDHNTSPLAFRWLVFGSHYRNPMEFSWEALASAQANVDTVKQLVRRLREFASPKKESGKANGEILEKFTAALADDLNTAEAAAVFLEYVGDVNRALDKNEVADDELHQFWATLLALDGVIGIIAPQLTEIESETISDDIKKLVAAREAARKNKQFERSDELRLEIEQAGYTLEDTPTGPRVYKK